MAIDKCPLSMKSQLKDVLGKGVSKEQFLKKTLGGKEREDKKSAT